MQLKILYYTDFPPYYVFDVTAQRYRPSTASDPSIYGELFNFAFFHNASQNTKMMEFNRSISYDILAYNEELDIQGMADFITIINTTIWAPSNILAEIEFHIISGKPLSYILNIWDMFKLITYKVFLMLLFLVVLYSTLSYLSEGRVLQNKIRLRKTVNESNFSKHMGMYTATALFQGSVFVPKRFGSRILFGDWLVSIFIVLQYFSSYTISAITIQGIPKRAETLEDIAKNPDLRPIMTQMMGDLLVVSSVKRENDVAQQAIRFESMYKNWKKMFDALDTDVATGNGVLLWEFFSTAMTLSRSKKSNFYISKQSFKNVKTSLFLRIGLEHVIKETVNKRILLFQEAGLLAQVNSLLKRILGSFLSEDLMDATPLTFSHVAPPTFFLLCGCVVATITLIIELTLSILI